MNTIVSLERERGIPHWPLVAFTSPFFYVGFMWSLELSRGNLYLSASYMTRVVFGLRTGAQKAQNQVICSKCRYQRFPVWVPYGHTALKGIGWNFPLRTKTWKKKEKEKNQRGSANFVSWPLHTRDWEPMTITLQALSLVEKEEPVQVRFTLRLREQ